MGYIVNFDQLLDNQNNGKLKTLCDYRSDNYYGLPRHSMVELSQRNEYLGSEHMRAVSNFNDLKLPEKQRGFLRIFLSNLSTADVVERVVLFGSCAKGNFHEDSDVDLFIITKREPTIDEEIYIMAECPPDYENRYYVQSDIIIKPSELYDEYKNEPGMVQKYVEMEGVDLTGLL